MPPPPALCLRAKACDYEAIATRNIITVFEQRSSAKDKFELTAAPQLHATEFAAMRVPHEKINRVAFSADAATLFVGTAAGTLAAFSTATGELLQCLADAHFEISCLAVSFCGNFLLSGSDDTRLKLWKVATSWFSYSSSKSNNIKKSSAAAASSARAAVDLSNDGNVLAEINCEKYINIHTGGVFCCCFSPNGKMFASCGEDDDVFIFSFVDLLERVEEEERQKKKNATSTASPTSPSQQKQRFKSQELQGLVLSSNEKEKQQQQQQAQTTQRVHERITVESRGSATAVVFTNDSKTLIVGDHFGTLHFVECATKRVVKKVQAHNRGIATLAMSADGSLLATGSFDATVRLFSAHRGWEMLGEPLRGPHTSFIKSVCFSPASPVFASNRTTVSSSSLFLGSGSTSTGSGEENNNNNLLLLVSTCMDGTCCFWNAKTGSLVETISVAKEGQQQQHHQQHMKKIARIFSGSDDDEDDDGRNFGRFESHSSSKGMDDEYDDGDEDERPALSHGIFSPDGRTLCLATELFGCRLFAVPTPVCEKILQTKAREAPLVSLRFVAEDGTIVIDDNEAAVKNVSSSSSYSPFPSSSSPVAAAAPTAAAPSRPTRSKASSTTAMMAKGIIFDDDDDDDDAGSTSGMICSSGKPVHPSSPPLPSKKKIVAIEAKDVHDGVPIVLSLLNLPPPHHHLSHGAGGGMRSRQQSSSSRGGSSSNMNNTNTNSSNNTGNNDEIVQQQQQQQQQQNQEEENRIAAAAAEAALTPGSGKKNGGDGGDPVGLLPLSPVSAAVSAPLIRDVESFIKTFPRNFVFDANDLEMIAPLASGGQAHVFSAKIKSVGWTVAAKLYRNPDSVSDTLREIELAMQLRHPAIVQAHGIVVQRGIFSTDLVLLLELAECSLSTFLRENPEPDFGVVIHLARQIAAGLAHLHSNRIISRDVKPSNLLLFNGCSVIKHTDLGIARTLKRHRENKAAAVAAGAGAGAGTEEAGGGDMTCTATEVEVTRAGAGTLRWQAPETLRGERRLTPAVDVYSFGCILLQFLTGKEPWLNATFHDIISKNLVEEQWSPRAGAPKWLVELTKRCLSPNPKDRPRNGKELVQEFERGILEEQQQRQQNLLAGTGGGAGGSSSSSSTFLDARPASGSSTTAAASAAAASRTLMMMNSSVSYSSNSDENKDSAMGVVVESKTGVTLTNHF